MTARPLVAAALFALALGLPFGRAVTTPWIPGPALAQPLLVTEPSTIAYGEGGIVIPIPGRLRMQYVPLFLPGVAATRVAPPPGRAVTARVPLVALLAAGLLAWRRRSPVLARRAALAGAVALVASGLLAALPSTGAVVSVFGLVLLGTLRRRPLAEAG